MELLSEIQRFRISILSMLNPSFFFMVLHFPVLRKEKSPPFRRGFPVYCCTSGRPATEVSKDKIPANAEALATAAQFTSPKTAAVPMVAAAVWATVFMARMDAAFAHFRTYSLAIQYFPLSPEVCGIPPGLLFDD